MSPEEISILKEIASVFGQGAVTLIPLILWLRTKFTQARDAWVADFQSAFDKKIAEVTQTLRNELQQHRDDLGSTQDEIASLRTAVDAVTLRKREHSEELRRVRENVARLEGRIAERERMTQVKD